MVTNFTKEIQQGFDAAAAEGIKQPTAAEVLAGFSSAFSVAGKESEEVRVLLNNVNILAAQFTAVFQDENGNI